MKVSNNYIRKSVTLLLAFFVALVAGLSLASPAKAAEGDVAEEPVIVKIAPSFGHVTHGANMQLLSEDGTVMEEWASESDGYVIKSELLFNTPYRLHQVTPQVNWDGEGGKYSWEERFGLGYDVTFEIEKQQDGSEKINYQYYRHAINRAKGEILHKSEGDKYAEKDTIKFDCPVLMSVEIGMETLGTSADPDEFFEVVLDIPEGVPGQVMNIDLSNADADRNPSEVVIPENGSLNTSFWLKDGQSILVDGFPLFFGDYYSVSENNDTLNKEAYITKVKAMEYMNQERADSYLIQGITLISKRQPLPLQAVFTADEITDDAYEVMNKYANEELFALDSSVIDFELPPGYAESVITSTLGVVGDVFTMSDTLSDHNATTRTASKRGTFPTLRGTELTPYNGVYGDAKILFINRRDGVPISKTDEDGNLIGGAELEIKDSEGNSIHTFQSSEEVTRLIALEPGEYTLHEVSAPEGYEAAEDISFTVVDQSTVQVDGKTVDVVTMVDPKKPEPETVRETQPTKPEEKPTQPEESPKTGDQANLTLWVVLLLAAAAVILFAALYRRNSKKR